MEYPFEIAARRRVGLRCNYLKFNGYDCIPFKISEPTGLAVTFQGALGLLMIKVVSRRSLSKFLFHVTPQMRRKIELRARIYGSK
jgi:hypothetical protein